MSPSPPPSATWSSIQVSIATPPPAVAGSPAPAPAADSRSATRSRSASSRRRRCGAARSVAMGVAAERGERARVAVEQREQRARRRCSSRQRLVAGDDHPALAGGVRARAASHAGWPGWTIPFEPPPRRTRSSTITRTSRADVEAVVEQRAAGGARRGRGARAATSRARRARADAGRPGPRPTARPSSWSISGRDRLRLGEPVGGRGRPRRAAGRAAPAGPRRAVADRDRVRRAVGASTPATRMSWSPSTGWTGARRPAPVNVRSAAASRPGWRGASMSGR